MGPESPIPLILDLDETLFYATEEPFGREPDFLVGPYAVYRRPHLAGFLASCSACFRPAVHSFFVPEVYGTHEAWRKALARSPVRLQWDPDHGPSGSPFERRVIQLGLRGEVLARYAKEWLLDIEDISEFVREQRANAVAPYKGLVTPREDVYPVADPEIPARLGVSEAGGDEARGVP